MARCSTIEPGLGTILVVSTAVRLWLARQIMLVPDETYYRVWSKHLAAGYLDHPPLVAWGIAAGTRMAGDSALGVRLVSVLAGSLVLALLFQIIQILSGDRRRARDAVLVFACTPAFNAGGVLATPDALLVLGWTVTLWATARHRQHPRYATGALIGLGVGIACLAKLTGFVLLALVLTWPLVHRWILAKAQSATRRSESSGSLYPGRVRVLDLAVAVVLTLILVAPLIAWSLHHGGHPFAYQFQRNLGHGMRGGAWSVGTYLAGQAGIVGPIVLACALGAWWQATRACMGRTVEGKGVDSADTRCLLAWFSAPLFLGLLGVSVWTPVEANWPAPVWVGAVAAVPWQRMSGPVRRAAVGSSLLLTVLAVTLVLGPPLPLPSGRDPTARLHGWPELAEAVAQVLSPRTSLVVASRYQEAAEIDFHQQGAVRVVALPGFGRLDQYDLLPPPVVKKGDDVVWVTRAGKGSAPPFGGFERVDPPVTVVVGRGGSVRRYHVYLLRGAQREMEVRAGPGRERFGTAGESG